LTTPDASRVQEKQNVTEEGERGRVDASAPKPARSRSQSKPREQSSTTTANLSSSSNRTRSRSRGRTNKVVKKDTTEASPKNAEDQRPRSHSLEQAAPEPGVVLSANDADIVDPSLIPGLLNTSPSPATTKITSPRKGSNISDTGKKASPRSNSGSKKHHRRKHSRSHSTHNHGHHKKKTPKSGAAQTEDKPTVISPSSSSTSIRVPSQNPAILSDQSESSGSESDEGDHKKHKKRTPKRHPKGNAEDIVGATIAPPSDPED